jgi:hypothetical protein
MTPEIRRAALRAAAKAALVVSITGCSGSPKAPPSNTSGGSDSKPVAAASCADYLGSLATIGHGELPDGDPLKGKTAVYGAFKDVAARSAPRTTECCTEELKAHGSSAKARFECCSALGDVPAGAEPSACTPWGPPCPPAMA